jgi:hypothetical protein
MALKDHIVQQGESAFIPAKDGALLGFQGQEPSPALVSTWNLFRLALVSACILFAILVSTVYSLNRANGAPSTRGGWLETKQSPLHHILLRDQTLSEELKYVFCVTGICTTLSTCVLGFLHSGIYVYRFHFQER